MADHVTSSHREVHAISSRQTGSHLLVMAVKPCDASDPRINDFPTRQYIKKWRSWLPRALMGIGCQYERPQNECISLISTRARTN